jgi:hypothetical protein
MMADSAERLPLRADDMPEITDAGVGLTLLMVAGLMTERERQALHLQLAAAFDARDFGAVAALHRRMGALAPPVARMADVARAGIGRYDAGLAHPASDPGANARARRSLVKAVNWLERDFWPMYGTVRPVMPPASDAAAPIADGKPRARKGRAAMPAPAAPSGIRVKSCRKKMKARLQLLDGELARLSADRRPVADTARLIMLADRNGHAARCRACGLCPLSTDPLTRDIPAG